MCADAGFHADQARRYIGEPRFHLATRPLLPQHDGAARIVAHDVERVLADINAYHGDRSIWCLRHGVLLVFGAPCQLRLLAEHENDRTIPLTEVDPRNGVSGRVQIRPSTRSQISDLHPADEMPRGSIERFEAT